MHQEKRESEGRALQMAGCQFPVTLRPQANHASLNTHSTFAPKTPHSEAQSFQQQNGDGWVNAGNSNS